MTHGGHRKGRKDRMLQYERRMICVLMPNVLPSDASDVRHWCAIFAMKSLSSIMNPLALWVAGVVSGAVHCRAQARPNSRNVWCEAYKSPDNNPGSLSAQLSCRGVHRHDTLFGDLLRRVNIFAPLAGRVFLRSAGPTLSQSCYRVCQRLQPNLVPMF